MSLMLNGLLLCGLAALFVSHNLFGQTQKSDLTGETDSVYETTINKMFEGNKVTFDTQQTIKQIVIREYTTTDYAYGGKKEIWQQVKIRLPDLSEETISDYEARLKTSIKLKPRLTLGLKYVLLSKEEFGKIFESPPEGNSVPEYWKRYYGKYPDSGGYIHLSNVGFNKARDQALVYFVHWCNTACGTGQYILLSKKNNMWQVDRAAGIWIS